MQVPHKSCFVLFSINLCHEREANSRLITFPSSIFYLKAEDTMFYYGTGLFAIIVVRDRQQSTCSLVQIRARHRFRINHVRYFTEYVVLRSTVNPFIEYTSSLAIFFLLDLLLRSFHDFVSSFRTQTLNSVRRMFILERNGQSCPLKSVYFLRAWNRQRSR